MSDVTIPSTLREGDRHEGDIWALLQALPTKQDIGNLIFRVEEAHRRDIQAIRAEVHLLTGRVNTGKKSISFLE